MTVKYLKNRWTENEEARLAFDKILHVSKKGGILKNDFTPFGNTENDYPDFRGIDLSEQRIIKLKIEKADLSHSSFNNSWIEKSTFNNIIFEKVDFAEITDKGNSFKDVSFVNCKFNKAGLGYEGSHYMNCSFENGNFSKTVFIRNIFQGCSFKDCKLKGVDFNASFFEDCKFHGKLEDVWFRGGYAFPSDIKEFGEAKKNQMKNVSFEEAILKGVNFSNDCDLSKVLTPKTGNYQIFDNWANRLSYLKTKIVDWSAPERKEAEIFANSYLAHAKTQDWFLLNIEEIQQDFGVDVASNIIITLNEN